MTIYFLPGLGADHRLFDGLTISGHKVAHIRLPVPARYQTMREYAEEISKQIDTSEEFILIGVSLGGMIACELATITKPQKVILISSARNYQEIPAPYRFQGRTRINRIIPGWLLKYGAVALQGICESDSWKHRRFFRKMILAKPAIYYKRTVDMIVNWNRADSDPNIIHVHGTGDRTLPFKLVKPHHVIERGSHMMVYTRAREINQILNRILA